MLIAIEPLYGVKLLIVSLAVALLFIWIIVLKGLALWRSAKNNSPVWFVVLLIVNTLGILELIYLGTHKEPKNPGLEQVV